MPKSDFEVFSEMSKQNMDIRMSGNIVACKKVKAGGHVTMGVDDNTLQDIMRSAVFGNTADKEYYVALYVINKDQFDKIKKEG